MPLNLELKIQLDNFEQVLSNLKNINASYSGELIQKDIYYKTSDYLLKLRIVNGRQELIKYLRNENIKDRFSDYSLLEISSPDADKFLSEIFEIDVVVEKKRLLYMYNNTRIHLDVVKKLGFFLELETLVLGSKDEAQNRFNEIIKLLQLDITKQITTSYKYLLKEHLINDIN